MQERANRFFVGIIRQTPLPEGVPFEVLRAEGQKQEHAITTREEAVRLIEESTTAIHEALDGLTPSEVEAMITTPVFTAPMEFFMNLPGRHMDNHASQIDLLQTCWGDMDWHI